MSDMRQKTLFLLLLLLLLTGTTWSSGCSSFTDRRAKEPSTTTYGVAQASYDEPVDDDDEKELPPLELADFGPSKIGATVKRLAGKGPDQNAARELYGRGEQAYHEAVTARAANPQADIRDKFVDASEYFAEAASRWPDSALEEDALFRAGESQFFADRYVKANGYFEELLKKYPNTRYLDLVGARRFLIADYWLGLHASDADGTLGFNFTDKTHPWSDTFGHAVRVYDRMRIDDPTGKLADDATMAAANAHFTKQDFAKADQFYSDLRTHFPSSEHQFKAHLLGVQAKLNSYKGSDFTGDALEQAEKLIQQIRRQFPREAREHEAELDRAHRKTRYLLAEREWFMAEFYRRRAEYGAARQYCEVIMKEYPDTPFAQKARESAGAFAGKPLSPPQKLAWLTDLFPDSKTAVPMMATSPASSTRR
ncbi:MAG: outer membrane protein assembly factor BamD [Planctomycetes bacterium]|nr:outer membrane protein assembly factor BamD [Planctomycetota bacterium]